MIIKGKWNIFKKIYYGTIYLLNKEGWGFNPSNEKKVWKNLSVEESTLVNSQYWHEILRDSELRNSSNPQRDQVDPYKKLLLYEGPISKGINFRGSSVHCEYHRRYYRTHNSENNNKNSMYFRRNYRESNFEESYNNFDHQHGISWSLRLWYSIGIP